MSANTRSLVRTLLGYAVIGVGLYLTFLTGPPGFELSPYAYLFLLVVIALVFEQMDSLAALFDSIADLRAGGDDDE